jgi:hypothetical protein
MHEEEERAGPEVSPQPMEGGGVNYAFHPGAREAIDQRASALLTQVSEYPPRI